MRKLSDKVSIPPSPILPGILNHIILRLFDPSIPKSFPLYVSLKWINENDESVLPLTLIMKKERKKKKKKKRVKVFISYIFHYTLESLE